MCRLGHLTMSKKESGRSSHNIVNFEYLNESQNKFLRMGQSIVYFAVRNPSQLTVRKNSSLCPDCRVQSDMRFQLSMISVRNQYANLLYKHPC